MPHSRQPPIDVPSILATATPDPEWFAALEESPIPAGTDYGTDPVEAMSLLKRMGKATYHRQRALLNASRPPDVAEIEVNTSIPATDLISTTARNRTILCYPSSTRTELSTQTAKKWPLIVLIHGGGHSLGNPEMELPLARLLVQTYSALVVLPSYRLAPEHPFPASFNDCFEILKQLAQDVAQPGSSNSASLPDPQAQLLPTSLIPYIDVFSGFILGGTSAGCTITASISHLYHAHCSSRHTHSYTLPPLTGLFLSCGSSINPQRVPSRYKSFYLSQEQNKTCVPLDSDFYNMVFTALKPRYDDTALMAPLIQRPELFDRPTPAEDHIWVKEGSVRVYFQACGMDMNRDDMLIYERVLREEVDVETRFDLYAGFGHCFWGMSGIYAEMDMTKKRTRHTVEGIGWLLRLTQGNE